MCMHVSLHTHARDVARYLLQTLIREGGYEFTIAFENAIEDDWVTEKLYEPLEVGSVPVYFGAPNVNDFLPSPSAIINVREFPSAEALAKHLLSLLADPAEYARHLMWKRDALTDGIPENMRAMSERTWRWAACRLCDAYLDKFML